MLTAIINCQADIGLTLLGVASRFLLKYFKCRGDLFIKMKSWKSWENLGEFNKVACDLINGKVSIQASDLEVYY